MPRAAAHLPDALVRLVPDLRQMRDQRPLNVPARVRPRQAEVHLLIQRIHQFAIDVELQLRARGVADAHRAVRRR